MHTFGERGRAKYRTRPDGAHGLWRPHGCHPMAGRDPGGLQRLRDLGDPMARGDSKPVASPHPRFAGTRSAAVMRACNFEVRLLPPR